MRYFFLFVALVFISFPLHAQKARPESVVKDFRTIAPDTVVQGEPFTVEYMLTSRAWEKGAHALQGNGFKITNVFYFTTDGNPYSTLRTKVTYIYAGCSGRTVETPGMCAYVNGDSIYPAPSRVYVKQHPVYGEGMDIAVSWLIEHGQHPDSLFLTTMKDAGKFRIYNDKVNGCFCIVAKREVMPYIGHPVLAYSNESVITTSEDSKWQNSLLLSYNKQIEALIKAANTTGMQSNATTLETQGNVVLPLLGGMVWDQGAPYNRRAPTIKGERVLIGCVPLAVGMVMNYHKWPARGTSHAYYQPDNRLFRVDFDKLSVKWDECRDEYTPGDSVIFPEDLSRLLVFLGFSADADYDRESTSASVLRMKPVLCNNLGYSASMRYYHELHDADYISLLVSELNRKRPCVLSSGSHALVCDGYNGDFFHLNLGWGGHCNGYYRLKLGNYDKTMENLIDIKGVLCGIEPQLQEYKKECVLSKPGTLEDNFTEEEKGKVTTLVVSGPINSKDILFLRQLAGAKDENVIAPNGGGSLKKLDLKNAIIQRDKNAYLVKKATNAYSRYQWQVNEGGHPRALKTWTYDFNEMDEKKWKDFKKNIGSKQKGVFFTRTGDNKYYAHYTSQKQTIGILMFSNCVSLQTIILPNTIGGIGDNAFAGCISLQTIHIPKKVKEMGHDPFLDCYNLERIEAPKGIEYKGKIGKNCSPALKLLSY